MLWLGFFNQKEQLNHGVPVGVIAAQSIGEPGTQLLCVLDISEEL
jgi:hypothetical protein